MKLLTAYAKFFSDRRLKLYLKLYYTAVYDKLYQLEY